MCNPTAGYFPGKANRAGENMTLTSRDGNDFTVRISRPEGEAPYPTVLIIHDYFDPEHYYFNLADQYAGAGYLGVCPDLYHRHAKLPQQTHDEATKRIPMVGDEEVFDDVDVTLDYLSSEGLLGALALTGFCWGGRMAYLVAARHPEVKLLLPFYGHLTAWTGPDGNKPYSPLEEAAKIQARVLGFYGGGDSSIPLEDVTKMEQRLKDDGLDADLKVVEGAPHCFFMTPEWAQASDEAWGGVLVALKETIA
jgi:carboxymethylenebutenolidase